MSFSIDQARPVRDGEQLDIERLSAIWPRTFRAPMSRFLVEQFLHGHSNLTYLIKVGGDEWVLRRPPFGNRVKTAHDMGREYRILSRLHAVYPLAPEPVLYCEDESILGRPVLSDGAAARVILRGSPSTDRPLAPELVAAALRDPGRSHGRAACARLSRGWAGRARQAARIRPAPGDRLDQALSRRPYGRDARCGASRGLAGRATARPNRAERA